MKIIVALLGFFALSLQACEGFSGLVSVFEPGRARDRYGDAEHLKNFWNLHRRFGVVRLNGRLLLIAREDAFAQLLLSDIREYSNRWNPSPRVALTGGYGVAYDITDIATRLMDHTAERWAEDGPNCWNLCLVSTGLSGGFQYTDAPDFKHWINGPIAQKIERASDLQPGDVIAFRAKLNNGAVAETHGAIYVSPRIMLTKNGYQYNQPYRIADLDEVYNLSVPHWANQVDAYRVTPMWRFLGSRKYLPLKVVETAKAIEELERKLSPYYFNGEKPLNRDRDLSSHKWDEGARLKTIVKAEMANPTGVAELTPEQRATVDYLWKGFELRLQSIVSSGY